MSEGKALVIEDFMARMNKKYGKGTCQRMGDIAAVNEDAISTGSPSLDVILGGGVPRGRIIEIYGPESSGKTTLAYHVCAEAQRLGEEVLYIDAEHAVDKDYAQALGMDVERNVFVQPGCGEEALNICEEAIRTTAFGVIVIDSVAALVPKKELDGEIEDERPGMQARMMSKSMRKIAGAASDSRTAVVFINQIREKIGVMFGNPETTPGGKALKFYASVRMEIRKKATLKVGNDAVANLVAIKTVKNKCAPPFRRIETQIRFGKGIWKALDAFTLAVQFGVLDKKGNHYGYLGEALGNGKEACVATLDERPDLLSAMIAEVRAKAFERPEVVTQAAIPLPGEAEEAEEGDES